MDRNSLRVSVIICHLYSKVGTLPFFRDYSTSISEVFGKERKTAPSKGRDDTLNSSDCDHRKYLNQAPITAPAVALKPIEKEKKMTIAQKSLLKVDKKGMKSMKFFFQPKKKASKDKKLSGATKLVKQTAEAK